MHASGFRPDIQGLRGVAVLLVVLYHAQVGPRAGFVGVDVFFVISGFVIGQRLLAERARTGGVRLGAFYGRRVRRLLPAMAACTVVTAVAAVLLLNPSGPQQFALTTGLAATLLVANVHLYRHTGYFDGSAELNPFLHTWSLSVEEQFYLLFPVVLAALWLVLRRAAPSRSVRGVTAAVIAGLGVVSLALAWSLTSGWATFGLEAPERLAFFAMPTRVWEFAAGVLLAVYGRRPVSGRTAGAAGFAGVAGLVAVLAAATLLDPMAPHPSGWAVVTVVGTAAVIGSGGGRSPVDRVLGWRPLVALGDLSYGWYLWHWPMIVFARVLWPTAPEMLPVAAVVSLVPTIVSFRLVERRFRYGPEWVGRRTVMLGAVGFLVPLLVVGGLRWGSNATNGWGVDEPEDWWDRPALTELPCHLINRDFPNPWSEEQCSLGPTGADRSVLVVGDGNANSVAPAVADAAGALGLRTLQWSRVGCPLLVGRAPVHYERCAEWQSEVLRIVERVRPVAVVVANQGPAYTTAVDAPTVLAAADGRRPASAASAVRDWERALDELLSTLDRSGTPAVVVGPIPDLGEGFLRARLSLLVPNPTMPRIERSRVEQERSAVVDVERRVVAAHPDARWLDPLPRLCSTECSAMSGGRWTHLDRTSLTNVGSALMTEDVEALLRELVDR